jgi:hypothetical protein
MKKRHLYMALTLLLGAFVTGACTFPTEEPGTEEAVPAEPDNNVSQFIPVQHIAGVPSGAVKGDTLNLREQAEVEPKDATKQDISWALIPGSVSVQEAEAAIAQGSITPTGSGELRVRATVSGGLGDQEDYTEDFVILISNTFVPVTGISGVPSTGMAGVELDLSAATVSPADATNKTIEWLVQSPGGTGVRTFTNGKATPTKGGTLSISGKVKRGGENREDYTQDFSITITGIPSTEPDSDKPQDNSQNPGNPQNTEEEEEDIPRELTDFSFATLPDTLIYALGQSFNSAGLAIEGIYDDGTTEILPSSSYTLSPVDTSTAGLKYVTVRVTELNESAYFQILVRNDTKILQSISLDKEPTKKVYTFGETLSLTGIKITGTYYDSASNTAGTETISITPKISGYDKAKRGTQTVTVNVNGKTASFEVSLKVPADAVLSLNHYRAGVTSNHQMNELNPVYIKGKDFDLVSSNLQAKVTAKGFTKTLTYANGGLGPADIRNFNKDTPGSQTVRLVLDDKNDTSGDFSVSVVDAQPAVWFDYGYMRHGGDPTGTGPGHGKYYAQPNETLVLAPVRYLIGYNNDHSPAGVSYSWSVSGGSYDTGVSATGETFAFKPTGPAGTTYTVQVTVSGRNYVTGQSDSKTASAEVVCYTGTIAADKTFGENPSAAYPLLRHFAPGQFSASGSGYGWSLGAAGGYEVWRVDHQSSYTIDGNPMATWSEPGVVWFMEDKNNNNIPDEMWYELKGGDDRKAKYQNQVTRRYAITYFRGDGGSSVNEYGQTIQGIPWADSKGRTGLLPGGWAWGVSGNWVSYACTLLRDDGNISTGSYNLMEFSGYVDVADTERGSDGNKFFVADAMRADGSALTLNAVRFIKVQSAMLLYGGVFGEVSTEIHSAEFLGSQSSFPLP